MDALNDQGIFWTVSGPEVDFKLPSGALSGNLVISDEGEITLALNGLFAGSDFPQALFEVDDLSKDLCVAGILKETSQRVLLIGLSRGEWSYSFGGFSHEQYKARYCLAGRLKGVKNTAAIKVSKLSIDLGAYKDWLGHDFFLATTRGRVKSVDVLLPKPIEDVVNENIKINVEGSYYGEVDQSADAAALSLHASLNWILKFKRAVGMSEVRELHGSSCEFFMLLAACGAKLGWPSIEIGRGKDKQNASLYFYRGKDVVGRPKLHEGFVYYQNISADLGQLYGRWLDLRGKVGAGAYLFFMSLNPGRFYVEHLYASLIWGLESFHRRKHGDNRPKKQEDEDRVLSAIDTLCQLNSKERRRLKESVLRRSEYSLQDRLLELMQSLPISFDEKQLNDFCKSCADRRNDISHYGGYRKVNSDSEQKDFYSELASKNLALRFLYGALLLKNIGVSDDFIDHFFRHGHCSGWASRSLEAVGLNHVWPLADNP